MSISQPLPGLKVEVFSKGSALHEYVNDEEEKSLKTVTKYIEAQSGEEFQIRCTAKSLWPSNSLLFYVYLDGKYMEGSFMEAKNFSGPKLEIIIDGATHADEKGWFLSKFCFSELIIDDSHVSSAGDKLLSSLKDMGKITVKVYLVKHLQPIARIHHRRPNLEDVGSVPEKALKGRALSHMARLSAPVLSRQQSLCTFTHVAEDQSPHAEFIFKYRSRAALRALMIIPRTPSPVPLELRDVDTLNPEEMRELLRRQREQDAAAGMVKVEPGVKRGRSDDSGGFRSFVDDDEVSFVSAKRRRSEKISIGEDGTEIIDLT